MISYIFLAQAWHTSLAAVSGLVLPAILIAAR